LVRAVRVRVRVRIRVRVRCQGKSKVSKGRAVRAYLLQTRFAIGLAAPLLALFVFKDCPLKIIEIELELSNL
jgi:hypothetical protein